jgi:hypothetical protein
VSARFQGSGLVWQKPNPMRNEDGGLRDEECGCGVWILTRIATHDGRRGGDLRGDETREGAASSGGEHGEGWARDEAAWRGDEEVETTKSDREGGWKRAE